MGHSEGDVRRGHSHGEHEPRNSGGGGGPLPNTDRVPKVMQVLPSARTRQDPLEISWHFDGTLTRKLKV